MVAALHDMAAAGFDMGCCGFDIADQSISYLTQPTSVPINSTASRTIVAAVPDVFLIG